MGLQNPAPGSLLAPPGHFFSDLTCTNPADFVVMWDSQNRWADGTMPFWNNDILQFKNKVYSFGHRHSQQANFLFLDGHVKPTSIDKFKYPNFLNIPDGDARVTRSIMLSPLVP
jgi:prepilin-type processing-associated H-X9-DG protein